MTIEMKLAELLSNPAYVAKIHDLTTLDEIHTALVKDIPELTKEELDVYLTRISEAMNPDQEAELDETSLETVSGGTGWEVVCGVCAVISLCYAGGEAVGKAIKNWKKNR